MLALASPAAAVAAPIPTPSAPPAGIAPNAVTLTTPGSGDFINAVPLVVTGTKAAGASVQVHTGDSGNPVCLVGPDSSTSFECSVASLPQGPSVSLTAVQLLEGVEASTATATLRVLLPPTIASTSAGLSSGFLQGTGYPGANLTIRNVDGRTWPVTVSAAGSWVYVLPTDVPGGSLQLTASQNTPFSGGRESRPSASVQLSLDRDSPAAPSITTPVPDGTMPAGATTYAGTGETGATVTVFAVTTSGVDIQLCSDVAVTAGRWSCTGAPVPAGGASITAYQRDAAGNTGPGSPAFSVLFTGAPLAPTKAPAPRPTNEPSTAPVAPPVQSAPPTEQEDGPGAAPAPEGPWADRTPFTTAVQAAVGPGADLTWLRAVVMAVAVIALLLVPARIIATTLVRRRSAPGVTHTALTGRNRIPTHDDPAPLLTGPGTAARVLIALCVAGGIVLFARPVDGQPAYLRVFVASALALVLVNAAATWVPAMFARWRGYDRPVQRLSMVAFPVVLAVALLSRVLDLQPAFLFGVLFVIALPNGSVSDRGQVGLSRIGAVFALGLVGWFATTVIGTPVGIVGSFAAELVNIMAMAALGSAAMMMVPLGSLSGRTVLNWSKPAWFASALLIFTVLFAFLSPTVDLWEGQVAAVAMMFAAVAFGALGISLWIWRRMVSPNLTVG
ncbi:hypothetical protein GCM10011313_03620 [Mycetocola zhadangensis]|nr:hypothetical protein GCM10011313_03620 [Mycetocola zhadangensis]